MKTIQSASVLLLALSSLNAHAVLDVLITSGVRAEQSELTTPASITLITREQIDASGAAHISEVLRGLGGVQISDLYGQGSRSSVSMRGFGETANANTLILVDGRRLNNTDIAPPDLNSISLHDVERIEVVHGSAGVLFGDQAVGGVINIITREPQELRRSLAVKAGSYGRRGAAATLSQKLDNGLKYRLALDSEHADNYREHNATRYLNGSGRLGWEYAGGEVFAEGQYIRDELETPGALFAADLASDRRQVLPTFAGDYSNLKTRVGRLGIKQALSQDWTLHAEFAQRKSDGDFRISFASMGPSSDNSTQDRKVRELTPRITGWLGRSFITLGVDRIDSDYHLSSQLGVQSNDQALTSLYAQAVTPLSDNLDLTAGLRHAKVENQISDSYTFTSTTPIDDAVTVGTLGFRYRQNDSLSYLLRLDQNYRFAKVDEFTNATPFAAPSPVILDTQTGRSLETGLEWASVSHQGRLIVYRLDLENEIVYDPAQFINVNLDNTRRQGAVVENRYQFDNKSAFISRYTFTRAEFSSGSLAGNQVPFVARHSGMLGLEQQFAKSWLAYVELQGVSERVFSGDYSNALGTLPGHGVVNARFEYAADDINYRFSINNLLDRKYVEVGQAGYDSSFNYVETYYPSPERNFMASAQIGF
jgi:iron complex outermembrane receptor protein